MHFSLALALLTLSAHAINIVSSNDDGWAEINIRELYDSLTAAGHSVVISAPAENESGTGSDDATPSALTSACEFDSCPAGSPAYGYNASQPRFNYVNSYPVTAIKYGINTLASKYFSGSAPDLAVTGPNVGSNLGWEVFFSGTVGAATYAANTAGIPAIAFSGATGSQTAWNVSSVPLYSEVYAQLATKLTDELIAGGTPYLPDNVWLNVNFGAVTDGESCTTADDFKFVLSRIHTAIPLITADDVETCGSTRLPTETTVVDTDGCYASVSVGVASDKLDADATVQAVVLDRLSSLLTCL
ncbi:5'/3'-nucleotidase SurE [Aspergillus saccharolyticus JOP 1030-1]|uniref:Acid phosphatase n=1 Tax=Aspergillus saccharolyticus JOP 1030-1 TaxID=1450539 RepID=A0A319AUR5_9EURO|nr:acid phosphatase precursor [Aspergillus saccharolyticus JOP 1030-1]PYH49792.1 acid phosphatase precursor [Aspergillus saccharolyticus JOP 1030-1]